MRDDRIRHTALACFVLAGLLAVFTPAHANTYTGTVKVAWFGPSGEDLNALAGSGTFGVSRDIPGQSGKHFTLTYEGSDPILDPSGFKVYAVDLDVYFHSATGYRQDDGTYRNWDNVTGVNPGPESGTIPPNTDRAFVVISMLSPAAHDVAFTLATS